MNAPIEKTAQLPIAAQVASRLLGMASYSYYLKRKQELEQQAAIMDYIARQEEARRMRSTIDNLKMSSVDPILMDVGSLLANHDFSKEAGMGGTFAGLFGRMGRGAASGARRAAGYLERGKGISSLLTRADKAVPSAVTKLEKAAPVSGVVTRAEKAVSNVAPGGTSVMRQPARTIAQRPAPVAPTQAMPGVSGAKTQAFQAFGEANPQLMQSYRGSSLAAAGVPAKNVHSLAARAAADTGSDVASEFQRMMSVRGPTPGAVRGPVQGVYKPLPGGGKAAPAPTRAQGSAGHAHWQETVATPARPTQASAGAYPANVPKPAPVTTPPISSGPAKPAMVGQGLVPGAAQQGFVRPPSGAPTSGAHRQVGPWQAEGEQLLRNSNAGQAALAKQQTPAAPVKTTGGQVASPTKGKREPLIGWKGKLLGGGALLGAGYVGANLLGSIGQTLTGGGHSSYGNPYYGGALPTGISQYGYPVY